MLISGEKVIKLCFSSWCEVMGKQESAGALLQLICFLFGSNLSKNGARVSDTDLGQKKKKKDKSTTWMRYVLNSLHRNKSTSTVGNGARLQKLQVIPSEPLKMQTVTKIRKCITRCKCLGSVASRWVVMWCQSPTVMAERGPALLMAAVAPGLFLDWWPFLG